MRISNETLTNVCGTLKDNLMREIFFVANVETGVCGSGRSKETAQEIFLKNATKYASIVENNPNFKREPLDQNFWSRILDAIKSPQMDGLFGEIREGNNQNFLKLIETAELFDLQKVRGQVRECIVERTISDPDTKKKSEVRGYLSHEKVSRGSNSRTPVAR